MKRNWFGTIAAVIACTGTMLPTTTFAATPPSNNHDVALREGGLLVGQVVSPQGVIKPHAPVSIRYADQEVVRTTTDENGVFAAKGLRGGQYQLLTDDGVSVCRLWAPDTAPPAAQPAALVVSGNNVARGQFGGSWIEWAKAHPYITAGGIGTAVAVPLVLANVGDDDHGS